MTKLRKCLKAISLFIRVALVDIVACFIFFIVPLLLLVSVVVIVDVILSALGVF